MDQELVPLSDAKVRLHEVVRNLGDRDVVLLRYGRPVGAVVSFDRYQDLIERAERAVVKDRPTSIARMSADRRDGLAEICRARGVGRLVLFGSGARGELGPESDIDLLVTFEPMTPSAQADALFGLQLDLEALLGLSVDLLEEQAIRNPYLRDAIDRDRSVLFEAD